jgi:hypothetical protein
MVSAASRRNDIDWLRILAMTAVFSFHCARFFNFEDWHVKNAQLSFGLSVFVGVLNQWMMPLFFMLSAMSAYYALKSRTNREYIRERFKRLFIPLVFGVFTLIPPQVYIERVSHGQFRGSLVEFLPRYFDGLYGFGGNFAWMGLHLWYLEMLFLFALLTLPLFRVLSREKLQGFMARMAGWLDFPGGVFLLALPIALMELLVNLQPEGVGRRDFGGWSLLTYLVFFVLGHVVMSGDRFRENIRRHGSAALAGGLVTMSVGYFLIESGYASRVWFSLLRALNSWLWVVGILGLADRYLRTGGSFLRYANTAVLPFYILHQTVIVVIGFFIAGWELSVGAKYLLLASTSFVVIMVLYEFVVKRMPALRFLFGMKSAPGRAGG